MMAASPRMTSGTTALTPRSPLATTAIPARTRTLPARRCVRSRSDSHEEHEDVEREQEGRSGEHDPIEGATEPFHPEVLRRDSRQNGEHYATHEKQQRDGERAQGLGAEAICFASQVPVSRNRIRQPRVEGHCEDERSNGQRPACQDRTARLHGFPPLRARSPNRSRRTAATSSKTVVLSE